MYRSFRSSAKQWRKSINIWKFQGIGKYTTQLENIYRESKSI